jgi:hypothetical protein
MLDSAAGGDFMTKTVNEAKAILENMLQNFSQWHSERAPSSSRKINSVEEVDSLTAKVDDIYSYIYKQNVDNVPLYYLVENNAENIDINYIRNFGNNGYNNQYAKPTYVPNKYTSGNNISNNLENTMRYFISTQKELNKEFIAKFERFNALNEKVDHLTRQIATMKNHMQEKKNEEFIKYVQDIIDRSWEILHKMEEEGKESTMVVEEKEVQEVKMLNDNIKQPLLDLDKYSLNKLINILQSFANDPSFNIHQNVFGSYIANHVIKEKIQRYNNESMIPPKLGGVWIPKILIAVGKESQHAILDLGSSVNILSKELYDLLDLDKKLEKCDIDLLLVDHSNKHALGRINDVMIELHYPLILSL